MDTQQNTGQTSFWASTTCQGSAACELRCSQQQSQMMVTADIMHLCFSVFRCGSGCRTPQDADDPVAEVNFDALTLLYVCQSSGLSSCIDVPGYKSTCCTYPVRCTKAAQICAWGIVLSRVGRGRGHSSGRLFTMHHGHIDVTVARGCCCCGTDGIGRAPAAGGSGIKRCCCGQWVGTGPAAEGCAGGAAAKGARIFRGES